MHSFYLSKALRSPESGDHTDLRHTDCEHAEHAMTGIPFGLTHAVMQHTTSVIFSGERCMEDIMSTLSNRHRLSSDTTHLIAVVLYEQGAVLGNTVMGSLRLMFFTDE